MKKIILVFILTFSLVCFADDKNILIAYSEVESFPNTIGNSVEICDPPGVCVEIIKQAVEESGYKVQFVRFPNIRVLKELQAGNVDGAFLYSFNQERLASGDYPMKDGKPDSQKRLTSHGYYIYKNKEAQLTWDGKKIGNIDKSESMAIGVNAGYSVINDLKKIGIAAEEAKTTEQNLKKLENKRISGFVTEDTDSVDIYIESGKYKNIEKIEEPFIMKDYFLMFSHKFIKENESAAKKIWDKIGQIRESKTKKIMPKYIEKLKKDMEKE